MRQKSAKSRAVSLSRQRRPTRPLEAPELYGPNDAIRRVEIAKKSAEHEFRSCYRRDYSRLVHSPAFRRLSGKSQLFPASDSDFVRNRLTHSIEVAQIGCAIAEILNNGLGKGQPTPMNIDLDLVEFACLAHDIGHPPFGHNGEDALDECMKKIGGFEGNAQTLRIISCIEKKELFHAPGQENRFANSNGFPVLADEVDRRCGLNVTYRSLASILKYDQQIPSIRNTRSAPAKGYYEVDKIVVEEIKKHVIGDKESNELKRRKLPFRTLECSIMDVADDIAYSTYDLEDSLKLSEVDPLLLLESSRDAELSQKIAGTINSRLNRYYKDDNKPVTAVTIDEIEDILFRSFGQLFEIEDDEVNWILSAKTAQQKNSRYVAYVSKSARTLQDSGYLRCRFTSNMIEDRLASIEIKPSNIHPALDQVRLLRDKFLEVEVLKCLNYELIIRSPRQRALAHSGSRIITDIYNALSDLEGHELLPEDSRALYENASGSDAKNRVLGDYISGMTDRFATAFHSRLAAVV